MPRDDIFPFSTSEVLLVENVSEVLLVENVSEVLLVENVSCDYPGASFVG